MDFWTFSQGSHLRTSTMWWGLGVLVTVRESVLYCLQAFYFRRVKGHGCACTRCHIPAGDGIEKVRFSLTMIPISRQESFPIDVSEAQEKLNLLKLSKAQEKLNLLEKVGRIGEFVHNYWPRQMMMNSGFEGFSHGQLVGSHPSCYLNDGVTQMTWCIWT